MREHSLRSHYLARKAPRGRWVIAHRGFSGLYPENTMSAFRAGVEAGADAIELDVHLSKDGEVVVMHDDQLGRTTSGKGKLAELTCPEICSVDAGSWKSPEFSGERVPTLREVFDEIALPVMVEIKPEGEDVVRRTVEVIRDAGAVERAIIASFSDTNLRWGAEMLPECERLALGKPKLERVLDLAHIAGPHFSDADGKLVNDLHRNDRALWTWTVDGTDDIQRMIRLGADGIISNWPDRVIAAFAR